MSKVAIEKIVRLLGKLQERLSRVGNESAQTRDTLAAFQDEVRVSDVAFKTAIIQLKSGQETLLNRIQEVEFKNNKREEAQTLRDQNNVQALVNLRESTKKAFDQVAGDVKSLLTAVQRLNERVGQVESQTNANRLNVDELLKFKARTETNPAPALQTPPFNHGRSSTKKVLSASKKRNKHAIRTDRYVLNGSGECELISPDVKHVL